MSSTRPCIVPDDYNETWNDDDSDIELLDYDSESDLEITAVNSRESSATPTTQSSNKGKSRTRKPPPGNDISLPDVAIQRYKISNSFVIKPGDTVELKDRSNQDEGAMHSGDFLRIKIIIMNMETDEVRLRGWRMRRTKYLGQIFDWKMNELGMVLRLDEDDRRPPFVAGMEDVDIEEVDRARECTLTNKPYPFLSFRSEGRAAWPNSMSKDDIKKQIFHGGRLTCRVVNILYMSGTRSKPYGGIVRHLYTHEADATATPAPTQGPGLSRETSIAIEDSKEPGYVVVSEEPSSKKRRARDESPDFEILDHEPSKRKIRHPSKQGRLVFGDVFCGAGGASQGAAQAGYYVQWGLDNDEGAFAAYRLNHPGAYAWKMNAHDFPPNGISKESWKVDVLHLSPPCCYWSPAHTRDGPKDQENYEAIYTVGPILNKVKPRVATLEQTFGLATREQHKRNFLMLLYDIGKAGYDVRYKIQDLSQYGLVQKRKRLLIIAARRGTPLPPFPKPTHGAPGSGLKPYVYIDQALKHITRQGSRAMDDFYHQPKLFPIPKPAYDARTFLRGCITTGGTTACHPSGIRNFTPRELSLFQSFPYVYEFTGANSEATKQIGNAFPPIMAQAIYHTIKKTLEAFEKGLIGAEDDLSDLDLILEQSGESAPQQRRLDSFTGSATHSRPSRPASSRMARATESRTASPSTRHTAESMQPPRRNASGFPSLNLLDGVLDGISNFANRSTASASRSTGRRREPSIPGDDDEVIHIPSDSE
ncbi:uncharacterized protein J4E88_005925 [Alternaria novae-zelandiae]|uniref:uncharacterized protein n=1 Tax=Alternaria novae-zelandiae TaxID=430562 RepID=UPI0020C2583C|nr:uncharacterized protein J4E88_005925 [Alternaria novae-zelandiae]KAI4680034.1 hypothetical protein J4E88_005925 [Alternaria novae-zelandiae]